MVASSHQLMAVRRPERIARVVLTSSDAFDNFRPASFASRRHASPE
jgi:hypothetical protein